MRRDRRTSLKVLSKIEQSDDSSLLYEVYSDHFSGCDERSTPEWSSAEGYEIKQLALQGFLSISTLNDAPHIGVEPDRITKETYVALTPEGHDFLAWGRFPWKWLRNIFDNIPAILISVITALLVMFLREWLT